MLQLAEVFEAEIDPVMKMLGFWLIDWLIDWLIYLFIYLFIYCNIIVYVSVAGGGIWGWDRPCDEDAGVLLWSEVRLRASSSHLLW